MKKIAIDITTFSDQYKNRGIGNYSKELITRLVKNNEVEWHVLGFGEKKDFPELTNVVFHPLGETQLSSPKNLIFFQTKMLPLIKKIKPDLYFSPNFERGLPIGVCKVAITMHDVIPLITNTFSKKSSLHNFLKGLFYKYNFNRAKNADTVITLSEFSKQELIKQGFTADKIIVIYLGKKEFVKTASESEHPAILDKYSIKKPYILYYGGLDPNKNVPKLLKAFSKVIEKEKIKLVLVDKSLYREDNEIVAQSPLAKEIKQNIEYLKLGSNVILPGFIEEEHLPVLLHESEIFIHLSGYEGFGLAVIEAMSLGKPVIAANRSCYPELFKDATLLVNPDDLDSVAYSIINVLKEKSLREELSRKSLANAEKFSWDRTAEKTLQLFLSSM